MNDALSDSIEMVLVGGADERVVEEGIGPVVLGPEGPYVIRCQLIPVVLGLKERAELIFIGNVKQLPFDSIADSFLQGSGQCFYLNRI